MQELTNLIGQSADLIDKGAWLAAAALLIGLLARAAKEPWFFGGPFARVPRQRRWLVIAALGALSAILEALVRGVSWPRAIAHGFLSAGAAMLGHAALGGVSPEKPAALSPEARAALKDLSPAPSVVTTTLTIDGELFPPPAPPATPFTATWPAEGSPAPQPDLDFGTRGRGEP